MTVAELIAFLQKQPQDLLVAHRMWSEWLLMDAEAIGVDELSEPQPDGWIQGKRPDIASRLYLVFTGN